MMLASPSFLCARSVILSSKLQRSACLLIACLLICCLCRCEATYTKVLAGEYKSKLDINACCPGYVNTDMTSGRGYKTVLQGADTPAWLALLAPKGTSGKFFSDRKEESF